MLLQEYLIQVYSLQRPIADSTRYEMITACKALERWAKRPVDIAELNQDMLSRFVRDSAARYRPRTIRVKRGDLLALWRHAFENGANQNPPVRVRRVVVPEQNPQAWTMDEYARLLRAAESQQGFLCNGLPRGRYFSCLFRLAYESGLRRQDLWNLTIDAVSADGTVAVTMGKTGKVHVARVSVEVATEFAALSDRLKRDGQMYHTPLNWPHTPRQFYHWTARIAKAAGVPHGALQQIRRTGATWVERANPGAATRYLGHSTPALAAKHYIDARLAYDPVAPPPIKQSAT